LQSGDRLDGVGAADGFSAGFGEAEVLDLAFLDQVLDGAGDIFDGHVGIDAVLVEKIDASIRRRLSEASATCLMCLGWLFSPSRPGLPSGR
jgi:hypothetical protein